MSDASPPVRGTGGHCRNHVLSRNGSRRQIASNQIGRRCTGSRARRAPAPARTSAHRHRSRRLQCMPRSMPQALVRPRCAAAVLNVHVQCSACACAATRQLVRLFSSCALSCHLLSARCFCIVAKLSFSRLAPAALRGMAALARHSSHPPLWRMYSAMVAAAAASRLAARLALTHL
eukprot:scaffold12262_cov121-Isochrysis_galbana.AAC.11